MNDSRVLERTAGEFKRVADGFGGTYQMWAASSISVECV